MTFTGKQSYSDVEYSGVLHVNTDVGDDYAGVVFGYQNNKRFYVMMWRNENKNYGNTSYLAGTRGIQIKVLIFSYHIIIRKR